MLKYSCVRVALLILNFFLEQLEHAKT